MVHHPHSTSQLINKKTGKRIFTGLLPAPFLTEETRSTKSSLDMHADRAKNLPRGSVGGGLQGYLVPTAMTT